MKFSLSSILTTGGIAVSVLLASPAHAAQYPGALDVDGPNSVYPGQTVTYNVTATNISNQQLIAAVSTFHFDTSVMDYLPDQSTVGCTITNPGYVDCILGDMQIGEAKTMHDIHSKRTKEQIEDYYKAGCNIIIGCPSSCYGHFSNLIKKILPNGEKTTILKIPEELMPNDESQIEL